MAPTKKTQAVTMFKFFKVFSSHWNWPMPGRSEYRMRQMSRYFVQVKLSGSYALDFYARIQCKAFDGNRRACREWFFEVRPVNVIEG